MFELLEPIVEIFGDLIIRAICEHISGEAALSNVDVELPPDSSLARRGFRARFAVSRLGITPTRIPSTPDKLRKRRSKYRLATRPQRPLQQQAMTYYERMRKWTILNLQN